MIKIIGISDRKGECSFDLVVMIGVDIFSAKANVRYLSRETGF